ncbi:MAG: serine O-acetyltransferase [Myxococcota bacterium]
MDDITSNKDFSNILNSLCSPNSYKKVMHRSNHNVPMPSTKILGQIVEMMRSIIFPGYFGYSHLNLHNMRYYLGTVLDKIYNQLALQIKRGFCFSCSHDKTVCTDCTNKAIKLTDKFFDQIPKIRHLLSTDVEAAYLGDPAARNPGETIFSYPSIYTLLNYRVAHELFKLEIPLIPRIITEMAHSETGVDIHPGAQIDEFFFMDHCTGIVIGETCIIGKNVRIYQGVTLGAKSFPLDKNGNPIKGIIRHPQVENEVIIYSGATILGRVTIGTKSVIGGNVWLTRDVPPGSRIMQEKPRKMNFENGAGI